MTFRRRIYILIALLVWPLASARSQNTGLVPPTDLAYADIDRLEDLGILGGVIMGQRPYSRAEIIRLVKAARERLDGGSARLHRTIGPEESAYIDGLLTRLETRFGSTLSRAAEPVFALFDGGSLTFISTDADRRGFPAPHAALVEATIDPIAERRLGRIAPRGQTLALELTQRIEPTDWMALQARERGAYEYRQPTRTSETNAELLLGTGRVRVQNVALTVGRQQIAWSQTRNQGLFLASDAPALDAITLAGDHPFTLPGFLGVLGVAQATLVVADLGPSIKRSDSKLLAYKVSVSPASAVEIGGTFMNHFGGEGGRPASLGDRVIDFLPFVDIFRTHNYEDTTRTLDVDSDKLLGLDGRFRLDKLAGITVTGEILIDDFDVHRLTHLFTDIGSQTLGVIVPQIGSPKVSAFLLAKHMGILTYTHAGLVNGITTRGRLLGDELGPDAKSFSAELKYTPTTNFVFGLEGRSAIYSFAKYTTFYSDSAHTQYHFQKVFNGGNELRDIGVATLAYESDESIALIFRLAAQRVRNANFLGGTTRRDYAFSVAFRVAQ
jgi:hypothetical protein